MNDRRWQKNFTLSTEQLNTIIERYDNKISIKQICRDMGLPYGKVHNNLRLAGKVRVLQPRVLHFEKNGYFDADAFFKYYQY